MGSACFRASPAFQSLIWGKKSPFWWCHLPFPCHFYSLSLLKRKTLISKSPIFFQHPPRGGSPGCPELVSSFWDGTNRRCTHGWGGLRAVGWGLCLRRGWTRLPGRARAIQLLFVLVVIYALVIISGCWVIYDGSFWKKVLQPLISVLLLAKHGGVGDKKTTGGVRQQFTMSQDFKLRTKKTPCITRAHF